jgi:hypothetical protein
MAPRAHNRRPSTKWLAILDEDLVEILATLQGLKKRGQVSTSMLEKVISQVNIARLALAKAQGEEENARTSVYGHQTQSSRRK